MTLYDFKTADGELVDADFPFGEAPHLGETVELEGHGLCTRVVSNHLVGAQVNVQPFASQTIHPDDARELGHTRFDKDGSPVFANRREAEDFSDRSEGQYVYGAMAAKAEKAGRLPAKELARRRGLL